MTNAIEAERELGRAFLEVAHALGRYRFDHWSELTPLDRMRIEDDEWSLLTYSSGLTTKAVGHALGELQDDLDAIKGASVQAASLIGTVGTVKAVLKLAAAFASLGGAIVAGNPVAIASAASAAVGALRAAKAA